MDREKCRVGFFKSIRSVFVYIWAILSTLVFGIVCLLLSPISQKAARVIARSWNVLLLWVAGVKLKVTGLEKLDKGKRYVFVANHQSGLDIPVLYVGLQRSISFIAKKELFYIPIFGWGMAAVGHIWIDRSNARKARESIIRAVNHLQKSQVSLILFPEGTRSVDGKVADFKTGSFSLALQSGVEAVPVAIHDTRVCLPKSGTMVVSGTVHIDICDPIDLSNSDITKADISTQVRNVICEALDRGPRAL